ncbi:hypothetical protein RRG08_018367 [Elysia crispata]|uniref:Uncharacterized protein n=1 Tax=Elysia crispata TaxID=231223 RepID=A0AAE0YL80_9GAST|nr:hypothetical protein RRG08_018367 [Elysia crispata]
MEHRSKMSLASGALPDGNRILPATRGDTSHNSPLVRVKSGHTAESEKTRQKLLNSTHPPTAAAETKPSRKTTRELRGTLPCSSTQPHNIWEQRFVTPGAVVAPPPLTSADTDLALYVSTAVPSPWFSPIYYRCEVVGAVFTALCVSPSGWDNTRIARKIHSYCDEKFLLEVQENTAYITRFYVVFGHAGQQKLLGPPHLTNKSGSCRQEEMGDISCHSARRLTKQGVLQVLRNNIPHTVTYGSRHPKLVSELDFMPGQRSYKYKEQR